MFYFFHFDNIIKTKNFFLITCRSGKEKSGGATNTTITFKNKFPYYAWQN